jgi:spoIIIJ-associated protein
MTDQTDAPAEPDAAELDAAEAETPEAETPEPETPESALETSEAEPADSDAAELEVAEPAAAEAEPVASGADRLKQLETEGDIAADYLEELLDIADLDGDLDMDVEGDRAAVSIVGEGLDALVGPDGEVLESLQELTRLAVYRETGERSRLMLDIGGYRAEVRKNLVVLAEEAIEDVRESGEAVKLAPMSPFERKVVHDAVAAAGLRSESEGVEPTRCVVIQPAR